MRVVVRGGEGLAHWDAFVVEAGNAAGFLHTRAWAEIDLAATGARPVVVDVRDTAGRTRAGALLAERSDRPRLRRRPFSPRHTLTCPGGPVVPGADAQLLEKVLDGVESVQRARRARLVRIGSMPPASGHAADPALVEVFADRGYASQPWCTALVDLDRDLDNLFRALTRSARKAVRRAATAGVEIKACRNRDEFLEEFVEPYRTWSSSDRGFTKAALATWDTDQTRHYRFFVATMNREVLATLGTYRANGIATEVMSARKANGPSGTPAQDAVHWHAMTAHRDLGDHLFDLAGFSPDPATPKEQGIRRFKEKWGGRTVPLMLFEHYRPDVPTRLARRLLTRARGV